MNNVIFMVDIQGYKHNSGYEYSIKSWENWSEKNNCEFVRLNQEIYGTDVMKPNWHKFFAFDLLENENIPVDKLLVVDADTIIHPDTPDFFKFCDNNICGVHDDGSYDWTIRSIENYSELFSNKIVPWEKYINSGFFIIDAKLKDFFNSVKKFYFENREQLNNLQSLGTGTDQTPFNYMIHQNNIDLKILPYKYNMTCMPKKEIIGEDMLFTKLGYMYHFNGLPEKETSVPFWMKKTYEYLYGELDG